jgi:hypothetical protein
MHIPTVNRFQQVTEAVPLAHGPNDQLALLDGNVDSRACRHFRLDCERLGDANGETVAPLLDSRDHRNTS